LGDIDGATSFLGSVDGLGDIDGATSFLGSVGGLGDIDGATSFLGSCATTLDDELGRFDSSFMSTTIPFSISSIVRNLLLPHLGHFANSSLYILPHFAHFLALTILSKTALHKGHFFVVISTGVLHAKQ
jgi:hypothetical protein